MTKVIPSATGAEAVDCFVVPLLAMTGKKDGTRNDGIIRHHEEGFSPTW